MSIATDSGAPLAGNGKQFYRVCFPLLRNAVSRASVALSNCFIDVFGDPRPKESTADGLEHEMCSRMAR
jgi:hypothetical protein